MADERKVKAEGRYRNLNNEDYWIKRSEELADKQWNNIKNVERELARQYRLAMMDIRQLLSDFFTQFAKENGLSYQDARKTLSPIELSDYQAKVNRLKPMIQQTQDATLIAEFEKVVKRAVVTRLEALMGQIIMRLLDLFHIENKTVEAWLSSSYKDNYYRTLHMIQKGTGLGVSFNKLDERSIKEAITMAWSGDQFSSRIWDNKDLLVKKLRQTITQGFIKGESVQKMSKKLNDTMDSGYKNALRLVRTETAYVMGEATAKGYEQSGVVQSYIYLATLDGRTSSICRNKDNNIYKLTDKQVGVNYPPLHPNCRSAVAPYFDGDLEDNVRIARGEDGKTYHVPASMNYEEWYKQYVS